MDQLSLNPIEFLNKLNKNEEFKNAYIESYKSNSNNYSLLQNTKLRSILNNRTVTGVIKNKNTGEIVKEVSIKNIEEYNDLSKYIEDQKSKGVNLLLVTNAGKLIDIENGSEIAQSLNIALGQEFFK